MDLKRQILKLLKEDEEFRYAVAGLIGLEEVLKAIKSLQEQVAEHTSAIRSLQEHVVKLEERFAKLEERYAKLEERYAKLEEQVLQLEERFARLEERFAMLEERFVKIEERLLEAEKRMEGAVLSLQRSMEKVTAHLAALGRRYGLFTEDAFREAVKYLVEDLLKEYEVRRWIYYDSEGLVFGHPSVVEVDVLIKDGEHILVEYKADIERGDVAELARQGKLYEKATGVKPKLLLVGPTASKRAVELARELGVEIRTGEVMD